MNIFHSIVGLVALVFSTGTIPDVYAGGIVQPQLGDDSNYSEYWEQQFLFEDGTFATSQFLITNLPLSKHHGIQVGTLAGQTVQAFGPRIIVKNGRPRDGWAYDEEGAALNIFTHRLAGTHPGYLLQLKNTAAELDILFMASQEPIPLVEKDNKQGLPEITLYAPQVQSFGRWRAGPEIGGSGTDGTWQRMGYGGGYGLHVRQTRELHRSVSRWLRLTNIEGTRGSSVPLLHSFETPEGETRTILLLLSPFGAPLRFDKVVLDETDDGSAWRITARGAQSTLEGSFTLTSKLDRFRLQDHLSGVEQLVAGAAADIDRHQAVATYQFTLTTPAGSKDLSGKAILEDIKVGEGPKKRNRRLR
ncbi:MAG: hypothetical protein HWE25_16175 [Alphaproteobacteria bacterium]|nr:hypothetical protein [Alphaproteobacteria bacterium]